MTALVNDVTLDRAHRHDTSHGARHVGQLLTEPAPVRMPAAFHPSMVESHPEPARRWLLHAIEPGAFLAEALEITMSGEIRLGRWRPFTATEALVPDAGFVWAARTRLAGLPVRGFDSFAMGEGTVRWRLARLVRLATAAGSDITRSAADRLAAESVLLPTSLVAAAWSNASDGNSAAFRRMGEQTGNRATIEVAADGRLTAVSMRRWGRPIGKRYALHRFEVSFDGEYRLQGLTIPDRMTAAWILNGRRLEFFRAALDSADVLTARARG